MPHTGQGSGLNYTGIVIMGPFAMHRRRAWRSDWKMILNSNIFNKMIIISFIAVKKY